MQARFRRDGFVAPPMSPSEFVKYVGEEPARWTPLARRTDFRSRR
jgi:hypothetical protein